MAVLIDPNKVKVVAQNGQITLSLQIDLNINLNASGISAASHGNMEGSPAIAAKKKLGDDSDEAAWLVPDFTTTEKVKFGK